MRLWVVALLSLCWLVQAQPPKEQKLREIDARIAELERELDALKALRGGIQSGQIPESALGMISISPPPSFVKSAEGSSVATSSSVGRLVGETPSTTQQPLSESSASPPAAKTTPTVTGTPTGTTTRSGAPIYVGPRGGRYHYSPSGKKVYERRKN
jgi:hypothetical protein